MLVEESLKIKEFVEHLNLKDGIVLDLGSADKRFREYVQPYIDRNIFKPLRERGCQIQHLDLYGDEGIDMRLDIADLEKLHCRYDLVLCCNSFEHAPDLGKLGKNIVRLAKAEGYAIITTPCVFPYHKDPEDILFRPTIEELMELLRGAEIVESAYLRVKAPYETRGITIPLIALKLLMAIRSLKYKISGEKFNLLKDLKTVFGQWKVTYLVVKPETKAY